MSLYSWWKWGCHGLDTSGYDHADDMVDKYTNLLKALNKQIEKYSDNKEIVDSYFQNATSTLQANNAGTYGHWLIFYNQKVEQWKDHKKNYYDCMNEEFDLAKTRRDTVATYKSNWETTRSNEAKSLDEARERQIEAERQWAREHLGIG